jgi:hypothetical protein
VVTLQFYPTKCTQSLLFYSRDPHFRVGKVLVFAHTLGLLVLPALRLLCAAFP